MTKVLSVIDSAYRASLEEQDDAGLWFTAAVKNAGADVDVLLTGNAVNYAVKSHGDDPVRLACGAIEHPMNPAGDIGRMAAKGVRFFLVQEDAEERGIGQDDLLGQVEGIRRGALADFVERYDALWHW